MFTVQSYDSLQANSNEFHATHTLTIVRTLKDQLQLRGWINSAIIMSLEKKSRDRKRDVDLAHLRISNSPSVPGWQLGKIPIRAWFSTDLWKNSKAVLGVIGLRLLQNNNHGTAKVKFGSFFSLLSPLITANSYISFRFCKIIIYCQKRPLTVYFLHPTTSGKERKENSGKELSGKLEVQPEPESSLSKLILAHKIPDLLLIRATR